MGNPDPNPLPYGGLQYYQVHYILDVESDENHNLLARCEPITKGRLSNRSVVGVRWVGAGRFAELLQEDAKLTEMVKKVLGIEGEIRVDPLDNCIRIHGKWIHEEKLSFNETMFEIADRIAMHARQRLSDIGVKA